jgi:hypothetical protein
MTQQILKTLLLSGMLAVSMALAFAQEPARPAPPDRRNDGGRDRRPGAALRPADGPRERPGDFPGRFGPPPGMREEVKLVEKFDKNGDQRLDAAERKAARGFLTSERAAGRGPRRFGPPRQRAEPEKPPQPGRKLSPADVTSFPDAPLYAPDVLRTLFLDFENADWEKELADFNNTDVEVPAKLTVDGKVYRDVGVRFRGASSFFTVGEGWKRSLNLSVDFAHKDQRLGGYRTLNLLNSHTDPTFLRTVLYYEIAREYLAAPRANYVRVVINGESWGVFVNSQQFNSEFAREAFGSAKGARWKVPGSPRGDGGLAYHGNDPAEYRKRYEIKSKDTASSWTNLIRLCRVLNETPLDRLEKELAPLLDIDGTLKFLALENVLINSDGYWIRASDYNLYQDEKGRFHLVPHDANETFRAAGGPGMRGGSSGRGVELDPMAGAEDANKPLLSRLLAVPSLKQRYLGHVRAIAEQWLDWGRIQPIAIRYQALIADEVKADTRKLYPFEAFQKGVAEDIQEEGPRGPRTTMSLKSFVEQRRAYLLAHPQVKNATSASRKQP